MVKNNIDIFNEMRKIFQPRGTLNVYNIFRSMDTSDYFLDINILQKAVNSAEKRFKQQPLINAGLIDELNDLEKFALLILIKASGIKQ